VNMLMNLRVSYEARNFLTSLVTIRISRRILLSGGSQLCGILGSHVGDYEEYCLLGCDVV
jgi:hypothetical protein